MRPPRLRYCSTSCRHSLESTCSIPERVVVSTGGDMNMTTRARSIAIATALLATAIAAEPRATAQENYTPMAANLKARTWFQDAKFGMFIHWGVYSVLGDGEWIMETRPINRTDYAKLPSFFNPIKYDPAAWVALAKTAGMKYITITSKHHDGFAMFDSKLTDWNVVARTPYGKDVIGMLRSEEHTSELQSPMYLVCRLLLEKKKKS